MRPLETDTACLVSGLQLIPATDADVTAGTLVPAAEGGPVGEAETEKVTLPAGEGASSEEAKIDTEATEAVDGDRPQPVETEAAATQVHVLVNGGSREVTPIEILCLLVNGGTSFECGAVDRW